jgi:uncharacterized protein
MIEFDEDKRQANIIKHGCDFTMAEAFQWETAIAFDDYRFNYNEPRMIAYGFIGPRLHVLVYTPRGTNTRVISLRKANERERKAYAENENI